MTEGRWIALLVFTLSILGKNVEGQGEVSYSTYEPVPDFSRLKEKAIKELMEWEAPEDMKAEFPYYLSGYDNDNSPIWVAEMGKWDTRKVIEMGPEYEQNFKKYMLQFLRRCVESMKNKSTEEEPVEDFSIIVDMEGYNIRQTSSPETIVLTMWMARQFEQAFSKYMKSGIILNGNYVFTMIWNILKPVLGENVYKLDIFGSNKERWIPRLIRYFPRSQLPEKYGGRKSHKPVAVYGR